MTDGDIYNLLGDDKGVPHIDRLLVEALTIKANTDARAAVKTGIFKTDHIVSAYLSVVANIVASFPEKERERFTEQITKNFTPAIEKIAENYAKERVEKDA